MIQAAARETERRAVRCAIYTRKSHEEGLDQDFNSLDAQREACEAYVASQRHELWQPLAERYDDGGYTGGNTDRPALQRLLEDVEAGQVDVVLCYKLDRLSRSLADFVRLMERFEKHGVSFVSVTQRFDTKSSMGRLTLNVLLSFAEFERAVTAERIRDKVAAAKRRGKYLGGPPVLGYDVDRAAKRLVVNAEEADLVRHIFRRFLALRSTLKVAKDLNAQGHLTKSWTTKKGIVRQGKPWHKMSVHRVLSNRTYVGDVVHRGEAHPGEHEAIVDRRTWDRVQALLSANGHARAGETRRKTAALLKGLIHCGPCGRAMGTTFTTRRGKRYRYYRCSHAEKNGRDACPLGSVAAGEIEKAVVAQLRRVFRAPEMVARTFRAVRAKADEGRASFGRERRNLDRRATELKRAIRRMAAAEGDGFLAEELAARNAELAEVEARLADLKAGAEGPAAGLPTEQDVADALRSVDPVWDALYPAEQERVVRLLVHEVVINPDGLVIRLRTGGLASLVAELQGVASSPTIPSASLAPQGSSRPSIAIDIPMTLRRRSGRKEIVLPEGAAQPRPDESAATSPLLLAIARAHRWQEMLDAGEVASTAALAKHVGVDASYVRRILKLTSLAPKIVEAIVDSRVPDGLSLAALTADLPLDWQGQAEKLGF